MNKNLIFGSTMFVVGLSAFIYSSWGTLFLKNNTSKSYTPIELTEAPKIKDTETGYTFEFAKEAYDQMRYSYTIQLIEQKSGKKSEEELILLSRSQKQMGDFETAIRTIEKEISSSSSQNLKNEWIKRTLENGDIPKAKTILSEFSQSDSKAFFGIIIAMAENKQDEIKTLLLQIPETSTFIKEKNSIQEVLKTYESFSEGSPYFLSAMLANLLRSLEYPKLSLPILKNILEENPDYRDAWIVMGNAYLTLKQFDVAESMLEKAISLDPTHPQSPYLLGLALSELKMYDDAIIQFDTAIKNKYEPKEKILRAKADIFLRKKENQNALTMYEEIINSQNSSAEDFTKAITISFSELNMTEKAISLAEQASKKFPENTSILSQQAFVKNDIQTLFSLRSSNPQNSEILLYLGQANIKGGNQEEAKKMFKECYEKGNGNAFASECATRYNSL